MTILSPTVEPTTGIIELPRSITEYLSRFIARRRRRAVARAVGIALAGFIGWMLVCCLVDRLTSLPRPVRLIALAAGIAWAAAMMAGPMFFAMRRQFDWIAVASEVERCNDAFDQRLVTVVSQFHGSKTQRGAAALLEQLARDVAVEVSRDATVVGGVAGIVWPWAAVVCLCSAFCALWLIPWLGLPGLAFRFVEPLAHLPAVTTSRLEVTPGSVSVTSGRPLTVLVSAQRIEGSTVILHVTEDGRSWAGWPMAAARTPGFIYSIPSVDRDLNYYVTGGDATSPTYGVKVLHPPGVVEFRISYSYPSYTRLPSMNVSNTDGRIEAPIGAMALVNLRVTEPLQSAEMIINADRIALSPTPDPAVWEGRVTIRQDARYHLRLVGRDGTEGGGPMGAAIHAIPDRPPVVRLLSPVTDLCAAPTDIVPIRYEASDDFGLSRLVALAQVDRPAEPMETPIKLSGTTRTEVGAIDIGLSPLHAAVGTVVSVWLAVADTSGQTGKSEVRHLLISSASIDPVGRRRLAELVVAARLATALAAETGKAQRAMEILSTQAEPQPEAHRTATRELGRRLSGMTELAALLRQRLLRTIRLSASPEQSDLLAGLVDDAARCGAACQDMIDAGDVAPGLDVELAEAATPVSALHEGLQVLRDGEGAADVLVERKSLAGMTRSTQPTTEPSSDPQRQLRDAIERTTTAEISRLGLNPNAPDLDGELQMRMAAASDLARARQSIDFVEASRQWAKSMYHPHGWPALFDRRLAVAALAESMRPDADLIRAHDLQLAASAAMRLSQRHSLPQATQPAEDLLQAYPAALAAMEHEHRLNAEPDVEHQANGITEIHAAASLAREQMRRWAGELSSPHEAMSSLEPAMAANAAMARHEYDLAARIDPEPKAATSQPSELEEREREQEIQQSMSVAEGIDRAIDALLKTSTSDPAAATAQRNAVAALRSARQSQIHQAAMARLAAVPGVASLFSADAESGEEPSGDRVRTATDLSSPSPSWGRLRADEQIGVNGASRERDPAGYEDELKVYFDALAGGPWKENQK